MRSRSRENINLVITGCCLVEDDKEMYKTVKSTYRVLVFAHCLFFGFVALSLPLTSSLPKLYNVSLVMVIGNKQTSPILTPILL